MLVEYPEICDSYQEPRTNAPQPSISQEFSSNVCETHQGTTSKTHLCALAVLCLLWSCSTIPAAMKDMDHFRIIAPCTSMCGIVLGLAGGAIFPEKMKGMIGLWSSSSAILQAIAYSSSCIGAGSNAWLALKTSSPTTLIPLLAGNILGTLGISFIGACTLTTICSDSTLRRLNYSRL